MKVRMTSDCFDDGYRAGDVFEVMTTEDGNQFFLDNDKDRRFLANNDYEVVEETAIRRDCLGPLLSAVQHILNSDGDGDTKLCLIRKLLA